MSGPSALLCCSVRVLERHMQATTLGQLVRPISQSTESAFRPTRFLNTRSRPKEQHHETANPQTVTAEQRSPKKTVGPDTRQGSETRAGREQWQIQKQATDAKLGGSAWSPRKRISPDALAGIRALHATQPEQYTTETLSAHFKVSPDAIRRILKSKWRPDEAEQEDRRRRWEKRGQNKWAEMVELGIRPPKKWRDMGVGRVLAADGTTERPLWKKPSSPRRSHALVRRVGERWIQSADSDLFARAADAMADAQVHLEREPKAVGTPSFADRII